MSLSVRPDPDHPLGGHALLCVRGPVAPGPVMVSVTDLYEDRHLGPNGWQSAPVALGPYAARDEDDGLVVPIGPEIVDRIAEFSNLRIAAAGVTAELPWPETIRTSPARAGLGGLGVLSGNQEPKPTGTPTPEAGTDTPGGDTHPPPIDPPIDPPVDPPIDPPIDEVRRWPFIPILLGLALLTALAVGGWWYLNQDEPPVAEVDPPPEVGAPIAPAPEVAPEPEVAATPPAAGCDAASLEAALALPPAEGFAAVAACGAEGDPELRFRVIEAAADSGLGEAVAMIGRWYDPAEAEAVGSGFTSRDPAQAARYYHEAEASGYAPAAELRQAACAALDPTTDPTHELARELYCD